MWGFLVFFGVLFFNHGASALAKKPFVLGKQTDIKSERTFEESQSCFLQKNLPQHLNFTLQTILPRIESEVQIFTQQQFLNGKSFYVADGINYRDLYHAHVRYPGTRDIQSMDEFLSSQVYHLQYHSFEHLDLMRLSWLAELKSVLQNTIFKNWINRHIEKSTETSSNHFGMGSVQVNVSTQPPILDESELLQIAGLWHSSLGETSQGVERLMLRLRMINDLVHNSEAVRELMFYRSIASFDSEFAIINPSLNLNDHWQPLDIFYQTTAANPDIAAEIRSYTYRTGRSWVGNPTSRDGKYLGLNEAESKEAQNTFDRIIAFAAADPDTENVFKNTADLPKFVTAFAISGDYVFSFRYNMSTYCK